MQPICLPALGRNVQVGDLYDYYTDRVMPSRVTIPAESLLKKHEWNSETKQFFPSHQLTDKFKRWMVGINWHQEQSMEQGTLDFNRLWFASYLQSHPTEMEDGMARVTVFLHVVRQTEFLCRHFAQSRLYDYQVECGGRATHLVEQVDYGAEFVCCLRRPVDWLCETKESAEESICLAAKLHFDHGRIGASELEKISCTLYSSFDSGQGINGPFLQIFKWLNDAKEATINWRPVKIVLRHIQAQLETRILSEKMEDNRVEMLRNWRWIWNESRILSSHKFLQQLPDFEDTFFRFHDLLQPLWSRIEEMNASHAACAVAPELVFREQKSVRDLLDELVNWVTERRFEIKSIFSLLGDSKLALFYMAEIEARPLLNSETKANVFTLRLCYEQDPLIEYLQEILEVKSKIFKRPVFPLFFSDDENFRIVKETLRNFAEEAKCCANQNNSYQIGLVPATSQLGDGMVKTILFPAGRKSRKLQFADEEKLYSPAELLVIPSE